MAANPPKIYFAVDAFCCARSGRSGPDAERNPAKTSVNPSPEPLAPPKLGMNEADPTMPIEPKWVPSEGLPVGCSKTGTESAISQLRIREESAKAERLFRKNQAMYPPASAQQGGGTHANSKAQPSLLEWRSCRPLPIQPPSSKVASVHMSPKLRALSPLAPMRSPVHNRRHRVKAIDTPCKPCKHGSDCVKFGCPFMHPSGRTDDCRHGTDCSNPDCRFIHPKERQSAKPCKYGGECVRLGCYFTHPRSRANSCRRGDSCNEFGCRFTHTKWRLSDCQDGAVCTRASCRFRHALRAADSRGQPTALTTAALRCSRRQL